MDNVEPLGGFEKTVIALGLGLIALVLKSSREMTKQRAEANRFRWTDKNRWE